MLAIYKKETKELFFSASAYIFITAFLILFGMLYSLINIQGLSSDIPALISQFRIIMLFLIPIISMNTINKEQQLGTNKLLYSSPVKISSIVIAKVLANATIIIIVLLISIIYLAITAIYGRLFLPEAALAYLGLFLMSIYFLCFDIFVASFSKTALGGIVLSFFSNILLWFSDLFASSNNLLEGILNFISPYRRMNDFIQGQLSISSIVYFILFSIIFVLCIIYKMNFAIIGGKKNE